MLKVRVIELLRATTEFFPQETNIFVQLSLGEFKNIEGLRDSWLNCSALVEQIQEKRLLALTGNMPEK